MLHLLAMRTPRRDVLRILSGRLTTVGERELSDWRARGREPYAKALDVAARERLLPATDPSPPGIAEMARRVEARRSLLGALNGLVEALLVIGVLGTAAAAILLGAVAGVAVAIAAVALATGIRYRGVRRALDAVPLRHGLEPLAWALYYPLQVAQRVIAVKPELEAAGDVTLSAQAVELEERIERAQDDEPLPGQEARLDALLDHLLVHAPDILSSVDASRHLARLLSDRAPIATDLIRSELQRQVGRAPNPRLSNGSGLVADAIATAAYSTLMHESLRFATLPRPEEPMPDTPLATMARDPAFVALVAASHELLAEGARVARGEWPAPPPMLWDPPTSRRWAIVSSLTGVALVVGGLVLATRKEHEDLAHTLIGVGVVLIPGTAGRVLKEALPDPAPPANAA